MHILSEYHLLEDKEVVLVTPLSSILDRVRSWLLPRSFFESYDFSKRPHVIHKELQKYEINETIQRVLGLF